jgi:hypothetical protein
MCFFLYYFNVLYLFCFAVARLSAAESCAFAAGIWFDAAPAPPDLLTPRRRRPTTQVKSSYKRGSSWLAPCQLSACSRSVRKLARQTTLVFSVLFLNRPRLLFKNSLPRMSEGDVPLATARHSQPFPSQPAAAAAAAAAANHTNQSQGAACTHSTGLPRHMVAVFSFHFLLFCIWSAPGPVDSRGQFRLWICGGLKGSAQSLCRSQRCPASHRVSH